MIRAKVKVFLRTFSSINVAVQGVLMEVLVEEVKNLTKLLLVRNLLDMAILVYPLSPYLGPLLGDI